MIGKLVKRKIGGSVGVLMSETPDEESGGFIYEIAFGYLTKADAIKHKTFTTKWTKVHSYNVDFIDKIHSEK